MVWQRAVWLYNGAVSLIMYSFKVSGGVLAIKFYLVQELARRSENLPHFQIQGQLNFYLLKTF